MSLRVLGVVTARGGSKGIPRKNIRLLAGKPLIQYTIEAVLASSRLTTTILSTDDPEIAQVSQGLGLNAPFLRPPELAGDSTPTLPVLRHAVGWLEERGQRFDAICLLQPTCPLRRPGVVDRAIELLEQTGSDSVVTILPVPAEYNPHWVFFRGETGLLRLSTGEKAPVPRRQLLPPAFHRDGSVYVTRRDVLMVGGSLYGESIAGLETDPTFHVNIDEPADWDQAEALLSVVA